MKKVTTLILLFCCMMAQANNLYLFTNASKTITAGGYIGPEKTNDEITWLFKTDSGNIEIFTEMENLSLTLKEQKKMEDIEDGVCSDVYVTDIGTIFVDFECGNFGEFLQIIWVIDNNEYIFRMK